MIGTDVEVGGVTSATIPKNTVTESRFVVSKHQSINQLADKKSMPLSKRKTDKQTDKHLRSVIFSPHSAGIVKPRTLLNRNNIDGMIQFIP